MRAELALWLLQGTSEWPGSKNEHPHGLGPWVLCVKAREGLC